jgi:hypothetical protein
LDFTPDLHMSTLRTTDPRNLDRLACSGNLGLRSLLPNRVAHSSQSRLVERGAWVTTGSALFTHTACCIGYPCYLSGAETGKRRGWEREMWQFRVWEASSSWQIKLRKAYSGPRARDSSFLRWRRPAMDSSIVDATRIRILW